MDKVKFALQYVNIFFAIVAWYAGSISGLQYVGKLLSWKEEDKQAGAAFGLCLCYLLWYYGVI